MQEQWKRIIGMAIFPKPFIQMKFIQIKAFGEISMQSNNEHTNLMYTNALPFIPAQPFSTQGTAPPHTWLTDLLLFYRLSQSLFLSLI